ncbi:hypothetical protein EON64_08105, partial [archaeon]
MNTASSSSAAFVSPQRSRKAPQSLPLYTEIHTISPSAAGVPILEVVKKLDEEKFLSKDDRSILQDILYNKATGDVDGSVLARRENVVRALQYIELQMYSKASIQQFKHLLYSSTVSQHNHPNKQARPK